MEIKKEELLSKLQDLKSKGYDMLLYITAVDNDKYINIIYILYNSSAKTKEILSVDLQEPLSIDSASPLYASAVWYERELAEMFGISINGFKRKRLLLEEWNGIDFPLRKSFKWGETYSKMI
ncbi:MAG: NADH-quinone oxidoreductase subunit C [Candidatus Micrarchaeaceae archaeon]